MKGFFFDSIFHFLFKTKIKCSLVTYIFILAITQEPLYQLYMQVKKVIGTSLCFILSFLAIGGDLNYLDSLKLEGELLTEQNNSVQLYSVLLLQFEYYTLNKDTANIVRTSFRMADLDRDAGAHYQGLLVLKNLEKQKFDLTDGQLGIVCIIKGSIYYELNKKDSAIHIAKMGLKYLDSQEKYKNKALIYNLLGSSYREINQDSSIFYVQKSANLLLEKGDSAEAVLPLINLSMVYATRKQCEKSVEVLLAALDLLDKKDVPSYRKMAYAELAYCYIQMKEFEKAVTFLTYRDSVNYEINNSQLAFIIAEKNREIEEKQKQEKLQKLETEIKIAALNEKNKVIIFLLGGIVIASLIGILLLFFRLIQKGRVQNRIVIGKNRELKQLNSFKNKVLSIIGHDIRSPLAQVITYQQAKIGGMEFSMEEDVKMNNAILAAGESGLLVLDNLLEWANGQIEGQKYNRKNVRLWEALELVTAQFSYQLNAKEIKLKYSACELNLETDENLLTIVFRNLLSNAIKFSPIGSIIQISCEVVANEMILKVTDQGPGISDSILNSIRKGDSVSPRSGSMGEKGAGLGLTLTRDFVDLLEGKLTFDIPPYGGTVATIRLKGNKASI